MKPPRSRRDAVLLIAGLAAGFLLSPPVVQAAANHSPRSETAVRSAAAEFRQEVLLSAVCPAHKHCTSSILGCGAINGILVNGAPLLANLKDSSRTTIWWDQPLTGGENQVYETFQPGLAFNAPTINIWPSDSDAHYIIYGVADHGQCM